MVILRLSQEYEYIRTFRTFARGNIEDIHGEIVGRSLGGAFSGDETTPGLVTLVDDFGGVFLVLRLTREGEGVFGLAIGDLVNPVKRKWK